MSYDNRDKGVLFKNHEPKSTNSPQYMGHMDFDGTEYFISAWINETKNGEKFFSIRKGKMKGETPTGEERKPPATSYDDDIPF